MENETALMVSESQLIDIADEFSRVPHLSEKMLVDLVNGAGDSRDLLETKKKQGLLGRLWGGLDGSNRRRDIIIQEQSHRSIEVLTSWALDLTDSMRFTQENLILVSDKLLQTRDDLMKVAQAVGFNRTEIEKLEQCLMALDHRLSKRIMESEQRLLKVEDKQEIDYLVEAWAGDHQLYMGYPPTVQVAFLIDDLMRGERGRRIYSSSVLKHYLYDRIVNVYAAKTQQDKGVPRSLSNQWLPKLDFQTDMKREVTVYGLRLSSPFCLHNAIADYALTNNEPEWLKEGQEKGLVPEIIDTRLFAEQLVHEAKVNVF